MKTIYYYELLSMIQKGEQPDCVWYNHKKFTWKKIFKCYFNDLGVTLLRARYMNVFGEPYESFEVNMVKLQSILYRFKVTYNDDILDSTEKKYLSKVIKPFRSEVEYIVKEETILGNQNLYFALKKGHFMLPSFKRNTMYIGMESGKRYSVNELGL